MKIKNAKQTFLIFLSLIILSFSFYSYAEEKSPTDKNIFLDSDQDGLSDAEEKIYGTDPQNADTDGDGYSDGVEVKTGYDPLKPAPGDKIVKEEAKIVSTPSPTVLGASDENNLTKKVADKVQEIIAEKQSSIDSTGSSDPSSTTADVSASGATIADVQNAIGEVLDQNLTEDPLPDVSVKDIKIKKQDYGKLSDQERTDRKREDFAVYASSMFYILSSNSPQPITSGSDFSKIAITMQSEIIQAVSSRNSSVLSDWQKSGETMLEQIKDVEVPEELADTHIHAIRMAMYAKDLKNYLNASGNDPIGDAANLTKVENFIDELSVFSEETSTKLKEYGLSYDDDLKQRLKTQGVILPEITSDTSNPSDTSATSNGQ